MRLAFQTASLRQTTAAEYSKRFLFGGLVALSATLVANRWGPLIGGLFLAFPGIFPAGVSLVEKHKLKRESDAGKIGVDSARQEASVEAAGASAGALGLAAFAFVIWKLTGKISFTVTLLCAGIVWIAVAGACWIVREKRIRSSSL